MAVHNVLDITAFRAAFPAFADATKFSDAMLNAYYANAGCYIDMNDNCSGLNGACLDFALQLMLAHLLYSFTLISAGQTSVIVQGATIDKVTVSLTPPPAKNMWQWWLATSPYGLQLQALLQAKSVGGWAIGGLPERMAFRKVGGMF